MVHRFRQLCTFILVGLCASPVFAQNKKGWGSEYFSEIGSLLPNQIKGVDEILPMWSASFGAHRDDMSYSMGYANATAKGVRWHSISIEMRNDVDISTLVGSIDLGADLHALQKPGSHGFTWIGGAHVGGGVMALISHGLYARMNMKFNASPGVALFLGFGLLYRPSEDTDKK